MHLREELTRLFDYDQWANLLWLEPAKALEADEVLLHIVDTQIHWLSRIEERPIWSPTIENFAMDLDRSVRGWQRMLFGADLGHLVEYKNSTGNVFEQTVLEIARHVVNHGTYHRGHLRGIADARGVEEFPETDYSAFCRERKRVGLL